MIPQTRPRLVCLLAALQAAALLTSTGQELAPQAADRIFQGYLYIEPYQARFECLLDLRTALELLAITDLKDEELSTDSAAAVLEKARQLAEPWCTLNSENGPAASRLVLRQFVLGEPGRTLPLPQGAPIKMSGTMLGLMWECPLGAEPQSVQVSWQAFNESLSKLPVTLFFGRTRETASLDPTTPTLVWENQSRLPPSKPLAMVPPLPEPPALVLPLASLVWILIGALAGAYLWSKRRLPNRAWLAGWTAVWLATGIAISPWLVIRLPRPGSVAAPSLSTAPEADPIVSPLLRNVYRAFDHRHESDIYDVLARSADGPLLKKLYLDIIAALSLDEAEAARVHVAEFACEVLEVIPKGTGFTAKTSWSALGTVGHWGHSHTRTNVNLGLVTVQPAQGAWKITGLEVLDHRRL